MHRPSLHTNSSSWHANFNFVVLAAKHDEGNLTRRPSRLPKHRNSQKLTAVGLVGPVLAIDDVIASQTRVKTLIGRRAFELRRGVAQHLRAGPLVRLIVTIRQTVAHGHHFDAGTVVASKIHHIAANRSCEYWEWWAILFCTLTLTLRPPQELLTRRCSTLPEGGVKVGGAYIKGGWAYANRSRDN